jgi:hypothetical protein
VGPPQVHSSYLPKNLPPLADSKAHVVVVGSAEAGLEGHGKGQPEPFFPVFQYGLYRRNIISFFYRDIDALANAVSIHKPLPTIIVLIYNEERPSTYPPQESLDLVTAALPKALIINEPAIAKLIAMKDATNRFLSSRGIPVPRQADDNCKQVFSNTITGSARQAFVIEHGQEVDRSRYNTEFIDTRHSFNGATYYVSLRAGAVGGTMYGAWPRLRLVSEGNASVHTSDTPLDPKAIEHFMSELVVKRYADLVHICRQCGDALGPAFYAHDILPSVTGPYYVCEAGFKYDNLEVRYHLGSLVSELPSMHDHFSLEIADKLVEALLTECKRLNFL